MGDIALPDDMGYVLLKPNIVLRGQIERALDLFRRRGLIVMAYRIGRLPAELIRLMYAPAFDWRLDDWSHNTQAFAHGPVIGLLVRRGPGAAGDRPLQGDLALEKGSALPERLTPDALRSRLGASSRVFNSIHVPDDPGSALVEAAAWMGEPRLAAILSGGWDQADASVALGRDVERHGYGSSGALDGAATYFRIQARLAHAVDEGAPRGSSLAGALRALGDVAAGAASALARVQDQPAIHRDTLDAAVGREAALLEDLAREGERAPGDPRDRILGRVARAMQAVNTRAPHRQRAVDFLLSMLDAYRVFASDLEQYLVRSWALYPSEIAGSEPGGATTKGDSWRDSR